MASPIRLALSPRQWKAFHVLLDDHTTYLLYGGAAGGGKTYLGCMWLIYMCYMYPGTRWFIARKHLTDLRRSALVTMQRILTDSGLDSDWIFHQHTSTFRCHSSTSTIELIEADYYPADPQYDRFGSREFTGGWIEEAQEVQFDGFDVLKTRIGRCRNGVWGLHPKILLTCNPAKNWLYHEFYQLHKTGNLPHDRAFIEALHSDNPFLPSTYAESLNSIADPVRRQRLRDGAWEYDSDPTQLIQADWISGALLCDAKDGKTFMAIDPAGGDYGNDWTAIAEITGNTILPLEMRQYRNSSSKSAEEELAREIIRMATERADPVPAKNIRIDVNGLGAGLWAALRGLGWTCARFSAGNPPIDGGSKWAYGQGVQFRNLRAQALWELRERFRRGHLRLARWDDQLSADLQSYRYDASGDRLFIEDKSATRRRLGRSPDRADAVMMAAFTLLDVHGVARGAAPAGARIDINRRQV